MNKELKNKNFKVGDYVYCKNDDDFFNSKYIVGCIDWGDELNPNIIYISGFMCDVLPTTKEEYNIQKNNEDILLSCDININKAHKLFSNNNERQKIVDKMEVLKVEIDLALGFKNKKAFNNYVKEYKELEQELNKSEILV